MRRWSELADRLATTSRTSEKTATLAEYLRSLAPDELPIAAVFLTGRPFAEGDPRREHIGLVVRIDGGVGDLGMAASCVACQRPWSLDHQRRDRRPEDLERGERRVAVGRLQEPQPVVPRVAAALERPCERLERVAREGDRDEQQGPAAGDEPLCPPRGHDAPRYPRHRPR